MKTRTAKGCATASAPLGREDRASLLLAGDGEMVPAVAGPAVLGVLLAKGNLLAVGHRLHAVRRHAQGDQVVEGTLGTALAEGEVVLHAPALVAVPFHGDL